MTRGAASELPLSVTWEKRYPGTGQKGFGSASEVMRKGFGNDAERLRIDQAAEARSRAGEPPGGAPPVGTGCWCGLCCAPSGHGIETHLARGAPAGDVRAPRAGVMARSANDFGLLAPGGDQPRPPLTAPASSVAGERDSPPSVFGCADRSFSGSGRPDAGPAGYAPTSWPWLGVADGVSRGDPTAHGLAQRRSGGAVPPDAAGLGRTPPERAASGLRGALHAAGGCPWVGVAPKTRPRLLARQLPRLAQPCYGRAQTRHDKRGNHAYGTLRQQESGRPPSRRTEGLPQRERRRAKSVWPRKRWPRTCSQASQAVCRRDAVRHQPAETARQGSPRSGASARRHPQHSRARCGGFPL